jgi:hypothetical protein
MEGESEIVQAKHLFLICVEFHHFSLDLPLMIFLLQVSMVTQVDNDGSQLRRNVFSPLE